MENSEFLNIGKVGIYSIKYSSETNKTARNKFVFVKNNKIIFSASNLYRVVAFLMRKTKIKKLSEKQFTKLQNQAENYNQKLHLIPKK